MRIRKTFQGAYVIEQWVGGEIFRRQYMGYSRREAVEQFKSALKQRKAKR